MQTQIARVASAKVRWDYTDSPCRFTSSGDNFDDEWNTFGTSDNRPLLIECKSKRPTK